MSPSSRPGVSTYLEVFLLVGVAVGGSGIVLGAGLGAASSARGGGVSLEGALIRQGEYAAVETAVVYNTGDAPFTFTLSTSGVNPASYCYTLTDPSDGNVLQAYCAGPGSDPAVVGVAFAVAPGKGVLLAINILGTPFTLGGESRLTVTTSAGGEQTADAAVLGA